MRAAPPTAGATPPTPPAFPPTPSAPMCGSADPPSAAPPTSSGGSADPMCGSADPRRSHIGRGRLSLGRGSSRRERSARVQPPRLGHEPQGEPSGPRSPFPTDGVRGGCLHRDPCPLGACPAHSGGRARRKTRSVRAVLKGRGRLRTQGARVNDVPVCLALHIAPHARAPQDVATFLRAAASEFEAAGVMGERGGCGQGVHVVHILAMSSNKSSSCPSQLPEDLSSEVVSCFCVPVPPRRPQRSGEAPALPWR